MARRSKYETHVQPRLDEIGKWVELGWMEKDIYGALGIGKDSWISYKDNHIELSDVLKKNRIKAVEEIKSAMMKRATGFQYEEKRVITQKIEYNDGTEIVPAKLIRTEITTKTALPDTGASLVLLQHWDRDEDGKPKWCRDPAALEIRKQELALKEKQAEEGRW